MIVGSEAVAASDNLRFTYFELGKAAHAGRIWQENGFRACIGDFQHPICNFAADLDLDFVSAGRLADIAVSRNCFHVYVLPSDKPSDCGRLLQGAGFVRSYGLVQMVAFPSTAPPKNLLVRADSYSSRLQVALFMVEQFFERQPLPFRRKVAEATARASSLELLEYRRDNRTLGAAMVCFMPGMVGVYNLCVDSSLRGIGIGRTIVNEILSMCGVKGASATLQCDPKLENWYRELGFRSIGIVDVFTLARADSFVIMQ